MSENQSPAWEPKGHEKEHQGKIWTHPYMLYIVLTLVLFAVLILATWLFVANDWIPNRGISVS